MFASIFLGISIAVPGVHCLIAYVLEPKWVRLATLTLISSGSRTDIGNGAGGHDHSWFVDINSADFPILVTSASFSIVAYIVMYTVVRCRLQSLTKAKVEQLFGR